ncbi:MAG: SH3-like domain-containing protein [Pseudomonadota bacterium]
MASQPAKAASTLAPGSAYPGPRFSEGARVHVDSREAIGHCRTPYYVRGKAGTVASLVGIFPNPEQLAYHRPGLPKLPLYRVRFMQAELWEDYAGAADDHLDVDIYESWLEAADA